MRKIILAKCLILSKERIASNEDKCFKRKFGVFKTWHVN